MKQQISILFRNPLGLKHNLSFHFLLVLASFKGKPLIDCPLIRIFNSLFHFNLSLSQIIFFVKVTSFKYTDIQFQI